MRISDSPKGTTGQQPLESTNDEANEAETNSFGIKHRSIDISGERQGNFSNRRTSPQRPSQGTCTKVNFPPDMSRVDRSSLLAWSTAGTIVYAAPSADTLSTKNTPPDVYGSASRLYATTLALDITTRKTYLLDPVPQPPTPIENVPIDHMLFSEIGLYLATADQLGSITIWEQDMNSLQLIPRQTFPADTSIEGTPHDVGSRVVSLRWLHNDLKVHVAVKLAKTGELWTCQSNQQRGCGPCNTVGKEAFIAITKDGRVCLLICGLVLMSS